MERKLQEASRQEHARLLRTLFTSTQREGGGGNRGRAAAAGLVLALAAAISSGCATGGTAKAVPAPVARAQAATPDPRPVAPVVERLSGGREGFVIREPVRLDAAARADFERGVAMIREGNFEGGAEFLERVISGAPGLTVPHIDAAIAYNAMKKPEKAEPHLKAALELVPGHPLAGNEYGLLLRRAGRFAEARKVYEASLAAFPEYYPVEKNLAILCDLYLKDLACAQEHYEAYSKAVPKDRQVTLWLADLQGRTGHLAMNAPAAR